MRMWMVDPKIMCRKHLLGEHVEIHMLVGAMKKGKSIKGYIDKGLISPRDIVMRHSLIASEMITRGMSHRTDIDSEVARKLNNKYNSPATSPVNIEKSYKDLFQRCSDCWTAFLIIKICWH